MTVDPPKDDTMFESDENVNPRPFKQLTVDVMEMRDCSKANAERWINDVGMETAERRIQSRWIYR